MGARGQLLLVPGLGSKTCQLQDSASACQLQSNAAAAVARPSPPPLPSPSRTVPTYVQAQLQAELKLFPAAGEAVRHTGHAAAVCPAAHRAGRLLELGRSLCACHSWMHGRAGSRAPPRTEGQPLLFRSLPQQPRRPPPAPTGGSLQTAAPRPGSAGTAAAAAPPPALSGPQTSAPARPAGCQEGGRGRGGAPCSACGGVQRWECGRSGEREMGALPACPSMHAAPGHKRASRRLQPRPWAAGVRKGSWAHENMRLKSRPHSPIATQRSLAASRRSASSVPSPQLCRRQCKAAAARAFLAAAAAAHPSTERWHTAMV